MGIVINEFVKEVLAAPCFGFVATVDSKEEPVITRIFGFKYDTPLTKLTLYTFHKDAEKIIKTLSEGKKIAATTSDATNFKTAQFKGTYYRHYNVEEQEMSYVVNCNKKQEEILASFGITSEVFANWNYKPTIAIVMNVEEIFDQTPKINSGNKIN